MDKFKRIQNIKMGRPKALYKTIQKTYMFYESDIVNMLEMGKTPKEIFATGIKAIDSGWSPSNETDRIGELKSRISHLALELDSVLKKHERLCSIVEKGLDMRIEEDISNIKEIEKKLDKIYNEEDVGPKKNVAA